MSHQLYASWIHSQESTVDLSSYPAGIYLLVATIDGVSQSVRVIKE